MEMKVYEQRKMVEIWLTRAERKDAVLARKLGSQCRPFSDSGYTVVFFQSGEGDLYENTLDLLRFNRKRSAQRAAEGGQNQVS
jgi:hypothetical protein